MIIASLAFYLFAIIGVISALNVIFQRNPVHCVLWLILTFFSFAPEFNKSLGVGPELWTKVLPQWDWDPEVGLAPKVVALIMYAVLIAVLLWIGLRTAAGGRKGSAPPNP